jgi:hypothetical protein
MDLVDIIVEKKFFGQEFLTWLFWKASTGGVVTTEEGDVQVAFENKLLLTDAEGKEKVACAGQMDMPEAMEALRFGKKVQMAQLRLTTADQEFSLAITADLLEFKGVKLPKTAPLAELPGEEQEAEGFILERVYLFRELRDRVHDLLQAFTVVRAGDGWSTELTGIREWVKAK